MTARFGKLTWLWLSILVIALDQATKHYFEARFSLYQTVDVIPGYFAWTLAYNTGAAFSFLADHSGWQRWLFALIAIGVSVVLVVWMKRLKPSETWLAIALALVLGEPSAISTTAWCLAMSSISSWCTGSINGASPRSTSRTAPSRSVP